MTDSQKKQAKKIFWILFSLPFIFMIILFTFIAIGGKDVPRTDLRYMPDFKELENPESNLASQVFSSDQQLLGKYYFEENRTVVEFENLSPYLVNALVATEDARFYDHSGIDARGLGRVLFKTVLMGKNTGGGSTISQQLAKNLFPRDTKRRSKIGRILALAFTKFKEWVIAVKLERNYTKEEILAMYFNTVPFGSMTYGIKSAAKTFFNCSPSELKQEEAAVLVGLVQAPSRLHPVRNRERSRKRRNVVLEQMCKYGYLNRRECDSLQSLPLVTRYSVQSHSHGIGTYFREYLKQFLTAQKPEIKDYPSYAKKKFVEDSLLWENNPLYGWCRKNKKPNGETYNLYNDGLKIYTTINSKMQKYAEEAVREHMGGYLQPLFYKTKKGKKKAPYHWKLTQKQINRIYYLAMRRSERYRVLKNVMKLDSAAIIKNFKTPTNMTVFSWKGDIDTVMSPLDSIRYYKFFLHSGLMSMEPQTGYVRAYVGDINYDHFKFDNVMQTRRQVGSTFKPIIYTMAMMPGGFSPCHKIPNVPVTFTVPNQPDYTPRFSKSKRLDGQMITIKQGLAASLNQVSAWILKRYSPQMAIKLAKQMGINSEIPAVPSICVGAAEIKLSEMVSAYGTFANQGVWVEPIIVTRIEDKNGNVLAKFKAKKREVISQGTAYRMIDMMKAVVQAGTSTRIWREFKITNPVAGKTGTTNDNSDGWFIGMVPNLVTGVWVGGEERGIRFNYGGYGQGSSMALPIWGLYMQRVYNNKSLEVSKEDFALPESMDGIEMNCSEYKDDSEILEDEFYEIEEDVY